MTVSHSGKRESLIFSNKAIKTSGKTILPDKKCLITKETKVATEFYIRFQSKKLIPWDY